MTKERFVERYGEPLYTVGIGGSGGAIQQYLYGQNHRGPARRGDPDALVSRHGHPDHPRRRLRAARALHGRHRRRQPEVGRTGRTASGSRASTRARRSRTRSPAGRAARECIIGWRGLTPLAMNPLFGTAGAGTERMDPAVMAAVHWTHWEDVKNVYGVGPDGYARQTWDNVGVQYGLKALTDGNITPAEFLDLNAKAGSWKDPGRHGPGGPAVPARRRLRPLEPAQPADRRPGAAPRGLDRGDERGLPRGPVLRRRHRHPDHRLAAVPRGTARHAQQPPVVRLAAADARPRRPRLEPGHLVLGAGGDSRSRRSR